MRRSTRSTPSCRTATSTPSATASAARCSPIAAAALAEWGDTRIKDITLFAAQTDFSEPGELSLYISPAQVEMLEALMYKEGVLDSKQMGGAFTMLRAHDLLWQPAVKSYLKGERDGMIDLMAWNADGTRMPWKMHTEYLVGLYLNNDLAKGSFKVEGETGQPHRHPRADVRRRHRDRPRRAVEVGLQGERPHLFPRVHVPADERRPQRRHRQRPGASEAPPPRAHAEGQARRRWPRTHGSPRPRRGPDRGGRPGRSG